MGRRKDTPERIAARQEYEKRLQNIQPLSPDCRKLLSAEGFAEYYKEMKSLYPSAEEAYERLEEFHETITGHRRYSEFDSFRYAMKARKPRQRK